MSKFLVALQSLESWFQRQKRVLPWRDQPDVYRVWISEIMLQQTQVITVIPYFEKFIDRFPSVEVLAKAESEEVMKYWAGLGYYSRARNLHRGAQMIVENGRFPRTREEWLEIPGVGGYTAGAILSIALDQAEPILDGNVERVLSRVRCVDRQRGDGFFKSKLWKISDAFVKTADRNGIRPNVLNQALMELGAMVCMPRKPTCMRCPLSSYCSAYAKGKQEQYPPKKARKKTIQVKEERYCIVSNTDHILLRKSAKGEWRAGLWDFIEKLPREVADRRVEDLGEVVTRHIVTHHRIERTTKVLRVGKKGLQGWQAADPGNEQCQWVPIESCINAETPMGSAAKRTLKGVLGILASGN